MNIRDLIPTSDQWKQLQDVESSLLRRKRVGNSAGILAALAGGLQLALVLANKNYLEPVGKILYSLVRFRFDELAFNEIGRNQAIGWIVLFLAAVTYYILRRTNLLLKESKEPFRYTFWIQPFTNVQDTPLTRCKLKGDDRFHLLHHDLAEHLTQRIQRFSILEVPTESDADGGKPVWLGRQSSHIHISGSVVLREEENNKWVIHVMPLLRMGPSQFPATLAPSVKYPLNCEPPPSRSVNLEKSSDKKSETLELELNADEYNQMVERVYSMVATEVYAQIELDIRAKIALFPTAYTRAVALYNEAEDFARSNTIDAYERAIALYQDALRYFELMPTKWLHNLLLHLRFFWRREVRFQHQRARVVTGYAKCLIYKNRMSTLSGRDSNPLYELPELLAAVIQNVERIHVKLGRTPSHSRLHFLLADVLYPKDSWFNKRFGRSYTPRFETQKRTQFELYIVEALVHFFLGSWQKANGLLERAQATAADRVTSDPLYLLARGLVEPVPEKRIPYFRQAVDNEPNFQMAQWFLAQAYEKEFRVRDEIKEKRALSVINEYTEVLKINHGNIAALAAQGHLLWLISSREAKRRFEEGREMKAIARETFVGQLNYSLARIAAEDGDYDECRNRYTEAVGADPTLGAHIASAGSRSYRTDYDDIGPEMLQRFLSYKEKVEQSLEKLLAPEGGKSSYGHPSFTEKTLRVVYGFVLNDYANACLRYFHYHGSQEQLQRAIRAYEKATQVNSTDALPWFNLQNAYGWEGEYVKAADCFPRARELAPSWSRVAIDAARDRVSTAMEEIKKEETKSAEAVERMQNLDQELFDVQTELELRGVDDTTLGAPLPFSPWSAPLIYEISAESIEELRAPTRDKDALAPSEDLLNSLDGMKAGASSTKELLFQRIADRLQRALTGDERHLLLTRVFRRPLSPATPAALQGQAGADPLAEQQAAVADLLEKKERLNREQGTARREVTASTRRLDELRKQFREYMDSALKELKENSRLAALFDGDLPEQIDRLVAIPWRKLDVSDVETMIALAEVLAGGREDQPEYLAAAQRLAEHLLEMYPEDDRVVGLLQTVVPKLIGALKKQLEAPPEKTPFRPHAPKLLRDAAAKLVGVLEKEIEEPTEKASLSRAANLRRNLITKLIAVLEKRIEALPAKTSFSPRAAKRRLNHLNELLNDSNSRWKTIVDYWMQTDSRTFLALYWYVSFDPKVDRESLDKVRDQYFKRDRDVFENLLGHVYFRLDILDEAIAAYNNAISLNEAMASYHFNRGQALYTLSRDDEARSAFYRAHRLDADQKEYRESLARAYNALANKHYSAGEYSDAIDNYLQAISLCSDVPYFHSNLSSAWEYNEDAAEPIALQKAIDAMQAAYTLAPDELEYKTDLNRLRTRQTMIDLYGHDEMAKKIMSVTPIAIEYAKNLSDLILGEGQQDFAPSVSKRISEMRESVKKFFGVEAPSTIWRASEGGFPDGSYWIIIDEIPLVASTVYHDKKLCLRVDELAAKGIASEAATDPENGADAAWVQETDWDKATAAGLDLLDPVDVILRHLRRVISENLADFLGHSDVNDLLKKSEEPDVAALVKSHDAVNTLTMVLRGLLAEKVPMAAIEEIFNYFLEAYGKKSIEEMIEELRMLRRIREQLPGNSRNFTLLPVGKNLEKVLSDSLVANQLALMPNSKNPDKPMNVLAMPPETCQEALLAIRSALSSMSSEALVVSDHALRNPLRKLVELEFPKLHVLSNRELAKGVTADSSRTVDLK